MKTRRQTSRDRRGERGVTMLLVAVAMVSIVAMAALAIDIITLYVAKVEAQRAADAAAMAGAKALVAGGVTGDPTNAFSTWQAACGIAAKQAQSIAQMNSLGGAVLTESNVSISFPNAPSTTDCSGSNTVFGINPQIQVVVQRPAAAANPEVTVVLYDRDQRPLRRLSHSFPHIDAGKPFVAVSTTVACDRFPAFARVLIAPGMDGLSAAR